MSNQRGKQLNKYVPDYVLYDLETTGISANYDEVIEISAVKVRGGKIIDEFSTLVNPGRTIPYGASAVNHIYDEMVSDAPEFEEVLPLFLAFIGNDILVGHNIASFDMKFLYRDFEKYMGLILPMISWIHCALQKSYSQIGSIGDWVILRTIMASLRWAHTAH